VEPAALLSSAVVAAIVAGVLSWVRERQILDRKAEVDYRSNARRRLYEAIGPLRLQLLLAARDVVDRVSLHYQQAIPPGAGWIMDIREYYVQSTVYRLLRPLAIGQLIQRQISIADFAVDKDALELLRFDHVAGRMLAGDEITLKHPEADWSTQSDHLFRDNLRVAAASLVAREPGAEPRILDFSEFADRLRRGETPKAVGQLLKIFGRCEKSLLENPIFWLRFVGYGYACNGLVASQGKTLGLHVRPYDSAEMLRHADDDSISKNAAIYALGYVLVDQESM
jgi:hypothetical protein